MSDSDGRGLWQNWGKRWTRSQTQLNAADRSLTAVTQTDHALHPDMHRQSVAPRSQFGQPSAQAATSQALRNKKKEYEAISALEQSCAELIATFEDMATDLNTTAEATIGTISSPNIYSNEAEWVFWLFGSHWEGDGTLDGHVPGSQHKSYVEIRKALQRLSADPISIQSRP